MLRLPTRSKNPSDREALAKCVEKAAERIAVSPYAMAIAMSTFFEELVEQAAIGRSIRIPSFGMFAPKAFVGRRMVGKTREYKLLPRPYLAFCSSRGVANYLADRIPLSEAQSKAFMAYKISHNLHRKAKAAERHFRGAANFRRDVAAQARRIGMKV